MTWMAKGCAKLPSVLTKQDDRSSTGQWTLPFGGKQSDTVVTVTGHIRDFPQLLGKLQVSVKDGLRQTFSESMIHLVTFAEAI